jgi:hypothetical protein
VDKNDQVLAIGAAAGLGILAWLMLRQVSNSDQPRYEMEDLNVIGGHDYTSVSAGGNGAHFCEPEWHTGPVTYLPCRFPRSSGVNGSLLITQGFGGMMNARPQQADWMYTPPSEVESL